jgi:hypothetical protein
LKAVWLSEVIIHSKCQRKEYAMKTRSSNDELEVRATEALRTLLGQVSVVKLKEIRREKGSMLADVDVLGHRHTLACEVKPNAQLESLRSALRSLNDAHGKDAAIPVVIAPYMSPEAQALCKESQAGFIDLEGNARLAMGEVFIGKRAFTPHALAASSGHRQSRGHGRVSIPPAA